MDNLKKLAKCLLSLRIKKLNQNFARISKNFKLKQGITFKKKKKMECLVYENLKKSKIKSVNLPGN